MLAVVARTGKFLPVCLTFGPTNGPDDFAYVVDRVYAPGRGRRLRLGKEWLAYVDDLTVRTGRQVDGVLYRDAEYDARVKEAFHRAAPRPPQAPAEALKNMGFDPTGLGEECDARKSKRSSTRSDQVNVLRSFTLSASVAGRLKKKTCVTCFDFRAWLFLFMFCCMFVTCEADMNTHTTSNNSRRHVLICAVAQSGARLPAHFLRGCFGLSAGSVRRAGRKTSVRMPQYTVELIPGNR